MHTQQQTKSDTQQATLIGTSAILMWGSLALFTQLSGGQIPPFQMIAMTFAIAYLLCLFRWWRQGHWGGRYLRQPWQVWALGVGAYVGYHFCYFAAMQRAPAVDVSLIAYLWPLFIVLFSALLPGEKLRAAHLIGALIALSGCWFLISGEQGLKAEYLDGYLIAFLCALLWSSYSVLSRFVSRVPTDVVGWYCLLTSVVALFAHLLWEQTVWPETSIQWLGVLALGIGPMGLAFFTWDVGVKRGNLPLLGVLSYSAPLISTVLLVVFTDAPLTTTLILACSAIVVGSVIAAKPMKKP